MRKFRPRLTTALPAATLAAVTCISGAAALAPPAEAASSGAVVNEVYGGGGNSGATLTSDFIELANAGSGAVTLDGWSVQYISASPGATTTWQVTPLTGSLAGGGLYLVGEAAGAGGTTGLPATQAAGSINMSAASGTVALVDNSTALTCKTAADCAADPDVVDLVGYGTALIHEGSADAPGLSNTTSAQRITTTDTDQNGTDFTAASPTPGRTYGRLRRRRRWRHAGAAGHPRHPGHGFPVAAERQDGHQRPGHRDGRSRDGLEQGLLDPGSRPGQQPCDQRGHLCFHRKRADRRFWRLCAGVGQGPGLLPAVERGHRRYDLQPVDYRDRPDQRDHALQRQPAACPSRARSGYRPRLLRPGPGRPEHRVHCHRPDSLGA
ncbi:MAG TPA: lamin tail domain-containing protein [Streptosporangiaceae bacterium]|nr:lamin tail domain-containing protein [Streptosporangiaceae bacterium]